MTHIKGECLKKKEFDIKDIKDAIKGSAGIMSIIASKLKCDWSVAKKYVYMYPETVQALQDEKEAAIDLAEKVVMKELSTGDIQTAKWYLSTIGRDRGYGDEVKITGKLEIDDTDIDKKIDDLLKLREAEIKAIIPKRKKKPVDN
jgi:hypothetical protein